MTLTSIGDLAQAHVLRRQTAQAKADLGRLGTEQTTGRVSDVGARVRGDFTALAGIDSTLARLSVFTAVAGDLALITGAQQRALSQIDDVAGETGRALLTAANGTSQDLAIVARRARDGLGTAVDALNLRLADRAVFAGQNFPGPALAGAEDIMAAVATSLSGATTSADIEAAVQDWFDSPTGFASLLGADAPPPSVAIAPGEAVSLDLTAADPVLRDTLQGMVLAALIADPSLSLGAVTRADLARRAGQALTDGAEDRATLAGRLGLTEQRLAEAQSRHGAEETALSIARNDLLVADPYETATHLQEAESRLDMIYTLTARLQRLSLADYL